MLYCTAYLPRVGSLCLCAIDQWHGVQRHADGSGSCPFESYICQKNHANAWFLLAGAEGFEPSRTVLETVMLPLHHAPIHFLTHVRTFYIIIYFPSCVNYFFGTICSYFSADNCVHYGMYIVKPTCLWYIKYIGRCSRHFDIPAC